jgi:hypothetical protein
MLTEAEIIRRLTIIRYAPTMTEIAALAGITRETLYDVVRNKRISDRVKARVSGALRSVEMERDYNPRSAA